MLLSRGQVVATCLFVHLQQSSTLCPVSAQIMASKMA